MTTTKTTYDDILNFWFSKNTEKHWFDKNDQFDKTIKTKFLSIYNEAKSGKQEKWKENARSCLALIICLDQFPRNIFRNKPEAFTTDSLAISYTKHAIKNKFHNQLGPVEQPFLFMPLMHSENINDQKQSVKLFKQLQNELSFSFAMQHYNIIKRFGRFPHRNIILGRDSSEEEKTFLTQPGSSF